ncbi:MAG: CAP domain-containing protein [Alphaproteobacteria bacterium]|nr:CAP domain-containing protein [Alphaproteobacteria bacterium]
MARKADHGRAPPRAAPDPAKGALSLALSRWRRLALICLMALLAGAASARFSAAESLDGAALLLISVNQTRQQAGIPPLQMNARLNKAALAQARHLGHTGRLSHLGPNGEKLGARLQATAYDYAEAAENLASGPTDPARIAALWRTSPGHGQNMLNPAYSEAGSGHATAHDVDYWVVIFARPGGR